MTDAETIITEAIAKPAEVRTEEGSVRSHSLRDLIAALRYAATVEASKSRTTPIRITYAEPPGTT